MTTKLLEALREYWRCKRPKNYLFPSTEGQRGIEQPISDKTIWHICRKAAKRAGIKKRVGAHTLRHSFATTEGGIPAAVCVGVIPICGRGQRGKNGSVRPPGTHRPQYRG